MFDEFSETDIETGDAVIRAVHGGGGPPNWSVSWNEPSMTAAIAFRPRLYDAGTREKKGKTYPK